jgi:hypothetical protein
MKPLRFLGSLASYSSASCSSAWRVVHHHAGKAAATFYLPFDLILFHPSRRVVARSNNRNVGYSTLVPLPKSSRCM